MSEYENIDDELLEEDAVDDSVPDDLLEAVAETVGDPEADSGGVVWLRGENGKLYKQT
jgi:hypothetical protein